MRDIRFRAWHKAEKKMYRVVTLYLGAHEQSFVLIDGDVFQSPLVHCSPDEVELLQYTGLVDKNETRIFEGDIVRCLDGYPALVSYDEHHAEFHPFGSSESAEWGTGVEVIGNLYESSELLTSEHSP
jgi:uncharacterized phage protein (TIGR01671 family)